MNFNLIMSYGVNGIICDNWFIYPSSYPVFYPSNIPSYKQEGISLSEWADRENLFGLIVSQVLYEPQFFVRKDWLSLTFITNIHDAIYVMMAVEQMYFMNNKVCYEE